MKNIAPAIFPPNGIGDATPANQAILDWVHEIGTLTKPENIFWCDGSERENEFLLDQAVARLGYRPFRALLYLLTHSEQVSDPWPSV